MTKTSVRASPRIWRPFFQAAPLRYRIVNRAALAEGLSVERLSRLAVVHAEWIEATLHVGGQWRVPVWSESLAVGERAFVARAGTEIGVRARHRQSETGGNISVLRDPSALYGSHLGSEIAPVSWECHQNLEQTVGAPRC